jgi:hypothetical protein
VYYLLDVAVRRARGLGRGGDLTKLFNPGVSEVSSPLATVKTYIGNGFVEVPVLIPELTDVYGALGELVKLGSHLHRMLRAEGGDVAGYNVDPRPLPLNLQIALKNALERVVTATLNIIQSKEIKEWIASFLTTCDPRVTELEVHVDTRQKETIYYIAYSCKSHIYDKLRMWVRLKKYRDKPGIYLEFLP